MTGVQALERKHPELPMSSGKVEPLCVTMCETTEADQLMSQVKESRYVSRLKF